MIEGFNKANRIEKSLWESNSRLGNIDQFRPTIFLSHKYEDKAACRKIAGYLKRAGVDYYLDEEDISLQQAVKDKNAELITNAIKKGVRNSTYMLCVVSKKSHTSKWIPFEVGYGHAAIIDKSIAENSSDKKIKLSILTLEDLSNDSLPEYMHSAFIIRGQDSFDNYLQKITANINQKRILERLEKSFSNYNHPLKGVLNMSK